MSRHFDRCFQSSSVPSMARRRRRAARPILETCEPRALLSYSAVPVGYQPAQIQQAYNFNQISFDQGAIKGNGAGQTIAIVDAYDDPDFVTSTDPSSDANFQASDLAAFDRQFGIPDPPSFTKYTETGQVIDNQVGQTNTLVPTDPAGVDSNPPNWEQEEALDVEWAHAVAPEASIDLLEATSSNLGDLLQAVETAQNLPGVTVVSMSWGGQEDGTALGLDPDFSHAGVAFVASASDTGQFEYPAASPNVLGVGGTTLTLNASGNYGSESVWVKSGGGPDPDNPGKLGPDVGYNAGQDFSEQLTGFAVHDEYNGGDATPWTMVNGTSAGAPQWAALIAIADQGRSLEGLNPLGSNLLMSIIQDMPSSDFNIPNSEPLTNEDGFTGSQVYGKGSPIANLVEDALLQQVLVTNVSTTSANGTYGIGTTIDIQLSFDLPVTVTGVPKLALNSGGTASYQSGSGTNTLTFAYTVGPNQSSNHLDCTGMSLSGGTIEDSFGDAASLSLPVSGAPGSLSANSDIVIATPMPAVTQISSTTANGTYGFGTTIDIAVTFSGGPVTVTGVPELALNSGGTASYNSGSGTSTLTFVYTVGLNQNSSRLDCTGLSLSGGMIEDGFGDTASLSLPAQGASGSLSANSDIVIAASPWVTGVSATTANGTYGPGAAIDITVGFSSLVFVSPGAAGMTANLLTNAGTAGYSSGSGTNALTFIYTVTPGQNADPLDESAVNALLIYGTIADGHGDTPNLNLPAPGSAASLGVNKDIIIDTTAPTVTGVSATTPNGTYTYGAVIDITVAFSKVVYVTGAPELELNVGSFAVYSSGSGTNTLTFAYTIGPPDVCGNANPLDEASATALWLDGGTIADGLGNTAAADSGYANYVPVPASGTPDALGVNKDIVIDTTVVSSITSANGTYGTGGIVDIDVNFDMPVTVTGVPQLALNSGGTASYTSGSGTDSLTFAYTVGSGQNANPLDETSVNALSLSGGSITGEYGEAAYLTVPAPGAPGSLAAQADIEIDTTPPTVTGVSATCAYDSHFFGAAGAVIDVTIGFSTAVDVTGTPELALDDGGIAYYSSGSGTTSLTFTYTILAGQNADLLDEASSTALTLNGGTIQDVLGNAANLTVPAPLTAGSLGRNKAIVIDGTQPVVTGVSASNANGIYGPGATIDIDVTFNRVIEITGTPELALSDGGIAVYSSSATDIPADTYPLTPSLTFVYTVGSGQNANPLDEASPGALTLNGGTITDDWGYSANLTLPAPGSPGSLGANSDIIIDTPLPAVTSVSAASASGTYGPGMTIAVTATFNKVVNVTGTPELSLNDGGIAVYSGGSGTNTVTFSYTPSISQNTGLLNESSSGALILDGGSIKDSVGCAANLTLPAPGAAGSLGVNKDIVINPVATDEAFVESLYEKLLNRAADSAGLASWVNELETLERQGDSLASARSTVASGIAGSTEGYNDVVNTLYHAFLNRAADSGAQVWVTMLASGSTEEQVMAGILSSTEFQHDANVRIGTSNASYNFVAALYQVVLDRTGSATEIQGWLNLLPSLGYSGVAYSFVTSSEFRTDAVQAFYGVAAQPFEALFPNLLDRSSEGATPAEIAGWVNSGLKLLSIQSQIAGSQEFYDKA